MSQVAVRQCADFAAALEAAPLERRPIGGSHTHIASDRVHGRTS